MMPSRVTLGGGGNSCDSLSKMRPRDSGSHRRQEMPQRQCVAHTRLTKHDRKLAQAFRALRAMSPTRLSAACSCSDESSKNGVPGPAPECVRQKAPAGTMVSRPPRSSATRPNVTSGERSHLLRPGACICTPGQPLRRTAFLQEIIAGGPRSWLRSCRGQSDAMLVLLRFEQSDPRVVIQRQLSNVCNFDLHFR